jgi:glycosyltransferase involved in cell wall biosynthesis
LKLLFITPYFPPEVGAAQIRIYELALGLVRIGHQVSVLTTFPNYPSGIVAAEWKGKFFWSGIEQGIRIYRIWSYVAPNRGFLKRIISHLSFAISSTIAGLVLPKCDFNIVESPPLFDGFAGVILKAIKRVPYVLMISDLWPESAVQLGVLTSRPLIWLSKKMELLFYRLASAVLALTAGIRQGVVNAGIEPGKIMLFRNSVNCQFFCPAVRSAQIRAELRVADSELLVLYAGTFGLAQNLSTVLEAAAILQSEGRLDIRFVLAGDGAERDLLNKRAHQLCLENVRFLESLPKARMPELLNSADCVLVPLRDLDVFRGALPTKLFEAMACSKPIILAVRGEAEELVREADAGYCVAPEHPKAIRDALISLMDDRQHASKLGANGRRYVLDGFSRETRAHQLSTLLEESLCGVRRTTTRRVRAGAAT